MSISRHTRARRNYLIGFVLAAFLTVIPFALTALAGVSQGALLAIIGIAAVVQVLVHMRFFLHISLRGTQPELIFGLLFTLVIVGLMVGGTLWIMASLNANMPMQM